MGTSIEAVTKLGLAEKKRLATEGKKLLAQARALKRDMANAAHALGKSIKPLKDKSMIHALGFESFEALCNIGLGISSDLANQLVAISESFTAKQAGALGNYKATALIGLARALDGEHTPSGLLAHRNLDVGHGQHVDVKAASADKILAVVKELHQRAPRSTSGGVRVAKEDKAFVARLSKALDAHGVTPARVTAVAGPRATGGKLRIEIAIKDARALARALHESTKT